MTVIFSFLPEKTRPFPNPIRLLKLGGFSTSYVIATSELADSQVSSIIELSGVSIGYVIATSEPADS